MQLLRRLVEWLWSYVWIRYVIIGGMSFALNYAIFSALVVSGVWYVYATMAAGTLVWMVNFPLHKVWTFDDRRLGIALPLQTVPHFALKVWNTYLADPFILYYLAEQWLWHPLIGKVAVGVILGAQNYMLCRYLIFRPRPA